MWALVHERLHERLAGDPAVRGRVPAIERAVAEGDVSPNAGADEIADAPGAFAMSAALRLLVTGFGPFPGMPANPSAALAQRVAGSRPLAAVSASRPASLVLPTTYAAITGRPHARHRGIPPRRDPDDRGRRALPRGPRRGLQERNRTSTASARCRKVAGRALSAPRGLGRRRGAPACAPPLRSQRSGAMG